MLCAAALPLLLPLRVTTCGRASSLEQGALCGPDSPPSLSPAGPGNPTHPAGLGHNQPLPRPLPQPRYQPRSSPASHAGLGLSPSLPSPTSPSLPSPTSPSLPSPSLLPQLRPQGSPVPQGGLLTQVRQGGPTTQVSPAGQDRSPQGHPSGLDRLHLDQ